MGLFDQFPYTNFHELNLDWLIRLIKELENTVNNFVALNTIKYADPIQWNITTQYEANTVVVDPQTGTAYISSKAVPAGVALTNTEYWSVIFTLDIISANKNLTLRDDGSNVLATFASAAGDWLLWNGTLYKVSQTINVNEAYVAGYNLDRYTIEQFIDDLKTDLVSEIDDLKTEIIGYIGDLDNLTTTDKTNLVSAINELVSINNNNKYYVTPEEFGAVGDGSTDDTTALQSAIDSGYPVILKEKKYRITDTLIVDISKASLRGTSARSKIYADFSTSKPAIQIYTTATGSVFDMSEEDVQIGNFAIEGVLNTKVADGIQISDIVGGTYESRISHLKLYKITYKDIRRCTILGSHVWYCYFECLMSLRALYSLYTIDNTDTGEAITFNNCFFANSYLYTNINMLFNSCSFHYSQSVPDQEIDGYKVSLAFESKCVFTDCHFEQLSTDSESTTNNRGIGLYFKGINTMLGCEFITDNRAAVAEATIYVANSTTNNLNESSLVMIGCDVTFIYRSVKTFNQHAIVGNVHLVKSRGRAAGNTTQMAVEPLFSNAMTLLDVNTAQVVDSTGLITIQSVVDGSDDQTVTMTNSAYFSSGVVQFKWTIDVRDKSAIVLQYKNSTSDGTITCQLNPSAADNLQSVKFLDCVGRAIANPFNENDTFISTSGNQAKLIGIPPQCEKIEIGFSFSKGATGTGSVFSFVNHSYIQLI